MRFKKHRLALVSLWVLIFLYTVCMLCGFFSPYDPNQRNSKAVNAPPQSIHFIDAEGSFHLRPFVYNYNMTVDEETWVRQYSEDASERYPLYFFAKGPTYKFWGLFETSLHFFAPAEGGYYHAFGTDKLGRDLFSRVLYGGRISLSIGLIGVVLTFFLGILLGGIAGYKGGIIDNLIQRGIEIIQSIPQLPLWMALSASLPPKWSPLKVYFGITVILSFIGWTGLARVVRGQFLALREEDYVVAARLIGAGKIQIIFKHMLPSFMSHIITSATLAVPGMILGETALSFLGIGLRSPIVSWGVLLSDAQNYLVLVLTPWLLIPGLFIIVTVIAFNLLGDGLRDAADPYSSK
jgi:peptide/nickel transport system permease protein